MADWAFPKLLARRRDAGHKTFRTRDRRRAVRVTASKRILSRRMRLRPGGYSIFRRTLLLIRCRYSQGRLSMQFMVVGGRGPGPFRRQSGGPQAASDQGERAGIGNDSLRLD